MAFESGSTLGLSQERAVVAASSSPATGAGGNNSPIPPDKPVVRTSGVAKSSATQIEDAIARADSLRSAGQTATVIVDDGVHKRDDRVEIDKSNLKIRINEYSSVRFKDGASPTGVSGAQGGTKYPLLYITEDDVEIINEGEIDGNVSNVDLTIGVWFSEVTGGGYRETANGNIMEASEGLWAVDSSALTIRDVSNDGGVSTSLIVLEGCNDGTDIKNIRGKNINEVVDLNAYNDGALCENIYGENIEEQIVDINSSPRTTVRDVRAGPGVEQAINATPGAGPRYSSKDNPDAHGITVDGVYGVYKGGDNKSAVIRLKIRSPTDMSRLQLLNLNLECKTDSSGNDYYGIRLTQEEFRTSLMNGLTIQGQIKHFDDTAVRLAPGNVHGGLKLDLLTVTPSGDPAVELINMDRVQGDLSMESVKSGEKGLVIKGDAGTLRFVDLNVLAQGDGTGVELGGSSGIEDARISGRVQNKIKVGANCKRTVIDADYRNLIDNGTGTRESLNPLV